MRSILASAAVVVAALVVIAAAYPRTDAERANVRRVRAHLDSVLIELGARDLSGLTPAERTRRAQLLVELHAYRDRGVFPHNYDFAEPTPYFVDRKTGTLCAVGDLLHFTGHDDVVQRVARANNNVYAAQLGGDAEFRDWLKANGLTLAEAARIQVIYAEDPSPTVKAGNVLLRTMTYGAGAGAVITSVWNATANSDGHRPLVSKLGLAAGIASGVMGIAVLAQPSAPHTGAALSVTAGAVSVALASDAMWHHGAALAERRRAGQQHAGLEVNVMPLLALHGAGVDVALRF